MKHRIDMNHPLSTAASSKMHAVHPLKLLGLIFSGLGLLFTVLGVIFLTITPELLPQVFTADVWLNEAPDELALPLCGVVFGAIGLLFLIAGVIMLLVLRRQRRLREELEQYGVRVTGMVTDVIVDRSYTVNGRHPLRVVVAAVQPGTVEERTLRSGPVWETPLAPGDAVDVLFDPMNEKKYVILVEPQR